MHRSTLADGVTSVASPVTPAAAARVSWLSALVFLVLFATVHLLKPEIDPTWRFISEYAIGRFGWVMNLTFLSMAAGYVSLVVALRRHVRLGGRIGLGLLLVSAAGLVLAAVFTTQPIGTNPVDLNTSSKLHGWGALLGTNGAALGSLVVTASLARNQAWRSVRWQMVAAVVFILAATIWFMMLIPDDGQFGPEVRIGWANRVLMMSYWVWLIITARYAFTLSRHVNPR